MKYASIEFDNDDDDKVPYQYKPFNIEIVKKLLKKLTYMWTCSVLTSVSLFYQCDKHTYASTERRKFEVCLNETHSISIF